MEMGCGNILAHEVRSKSFHLSDAELEVILFAQLDETPNYSTFIPLNIQSIITVMCLKR